MNIQGWAEIALTIGLAVMLGWPIGIYMSRVWNGERTWLDPVLKPVEGLITGDNPVTAAAIASEAGVDDFLAEATPEDKMRLIKAEQAKGRLVAMCGDGANDAPALAQADVGVAMQTGAQAAREAGNMVDLDSDPTKVIEIVEVGKQLLITRGALTTFSIANDVAKYFAIIPAMWSACRRWRR